MRLPVDVQTRLEIHYADVWTHHNGTTQAGLWNDLPLPLRTEISSAADKMLIKKVEETVKKKDTKKKKMEVTIKFAFIVSLIKKNPQAFQPLIFDPLAQGPEDTHVHGVWIQLQALYCQSSQRCVQSKIVQN